MSEAKKIDARNSIKTVTSNSFITADGLSKLSLKARKMLYIAISQCKQCDDEFYEYEISVHEFSKIMGIKPEGVYQEADRITDELIHGILRVKSAEKKYFDKYTMFSKCSYDHNGTIKFKLNPDMTTFLLALKGDFSQPLLQDFMKMRSPYSMAIWHLMQREMRSHKPGLTNIITFDLSLEELRNVTGTHGKLKQLSEFKNRCFNKALKEIQENCGVCILYENIKSGRSVVGFRCKAKNIYYIDESQIPQKVKDKTRIGVLRIASKIRELTPEEREEYDRLVSESEQLEMDFNF